MIDPFIPFITPVELAPTPPPLTEDDSDLPPEPQKPLTPLQRMSVAEIDRGLRAITWGGLGRKAVIEDAAGKGYIVCVGTPATDNNGVITEIFNDRLVIQQETWDRKQKRMVPRNSTVKLRKEKEK
jgi:Tfp pilus assembly protein PilP